jgi:hypothetical protein
VYVVEYLSRQTASNAPALQRKFLSQAESKPASPKVASADRPPQTLTHPRFSLPLYRINIDISRQYFFFEFCSPTTQN